jgi:hypothetical protein
MVKSVTFSHKDSYTSVLKDLSRMGTLRVASIQMNSKGQPITTLRERTWKEWLTEKLPGHQSQTQQSRKQVLDALSPLIQKHAPYASQLIANINDRTQHGVDLTGRALKRDYAPIERGAKPRPLQGGTVAAANKGHSVHVTAAPAARIKCDHAVLRASTAQRELQGEDSDLSPIIREHVKETQALAIGEREKVPPIKVLHDLPVSMAAPLWTCIPDLQLPEVGSNQAKISESHMKSLMREVMLGKTGAVVIEPIPDECKELNGVRTYTYSDLGLRTQMNAARELVNESKEDFVITFASADTVLLERMQALHANRS